MASYEKINYLLRPNKSVERKMVCEMLAGISAVKDLSSYQYIGFGSTYFADFSLFHRRLGISKMISIEGDEHAKGRCEFNKPYACIDLKIGESSTILPNLEINEKDSIVWLDYDGIISDVVFNDIDTVVTMMRPDGFFMMSINADLRTLGNLKEEDSDDIGKILKDILGEERFPSKYIGKSLTQKSYSKILYDCIIQQILQSVQNRNGMGLDKVVFHQSVNFVYRDGVKMLTIGGFLFEKENAEEHLEKMMTKQYPFYKNGEESFSIQCPVLSLKEIQALNAYLPCEPMDKDNKQFNDPNLNNFPINNVDINNYASLYRYFPNFVETLL